MSRNRGVIKFTRSTWEEIGCPHFHDVHRKLLLPNDYVVEEVAESTDVIEVFVTGDYIPEQDGVPAVTLVPYYKRGGIVPMLDRIEVESV